MVVFINFTFDYLYEQKLKNGDDILKPYYKNIQGLVKTLSSKIKYLPEKYQEDALKVLKAMAYISLREGKPLVFKKISIQEILEGLNLSGGDEYIQKLLCHLREITGNQFIDQFSEDCFGFDLVHCIDYDQAIKEKASFLKKRDEIAGLAHFLQQAFGLDKGKMIDENLFFDYFSWPEHKGYQKVILAFNEFELADKYPVFLINIASTNDKAVTYGAESKQVILNLDYSPELAILIRELVIVDNYSQSSNYPLKYLRMKKNLLSEKIEERLMIILNNSSLILAGKEERVSELCGRNSRLENLYIKLKKDLFEEIFKEFYPVYPVFPLEVKPVNIADKVELAVIALLTENYNADSIAVLQSLSLLDRDNNPSISSSPYTERLIEILKEEKQKKVAVDRIFSLLGGEPYGLQQEFIYLLMIVLVYLGIIRLYRSDQVKFGGVESLRKIFLVNKSLFTNSLDDLKVIGYLELINNTSDSLQDLFSILGLKEEYSTLGYIPYRLYKKYQEKISDIREDITGAKNSLESYLQKPVPGIDEAVIRDKIINLDKAVLAKILVINSIEDLQKLSFSKSEIEELEISLKYIANLISFLNYFDQEVLPVYYELYMRFAREQDSQKLKELTELMEKIWVNIDQQEIFLKMIKCKLGKGVK